LQLLRLALGEVSFRFYSRFCSAILERVYRATLGCARRTTRRRHPNVASVNRAHGTTVFVDATLSQLSQLVLRGPFRHHRRRNSRDPSTAGSLRDPNNFVKQWRAARDELGMPEVTTHSLRETVATLSTARACRRVSARTSWGHSNVSMTQDKYMTRGRIHG
jgi:integrase